MGKLYLKSNKKKNLLDKKDKSYCNKTKVYNFRDITKDEREKLRIDVYQYIL